MRIFLFFLFPLQAFTQNIEGLWKGFLYVSDSKVSYELALNKDDKKINGYALTIFSFEGVENTGIKTIKLKRKGSIFLLEDDDLVYDNFTTAPKKVKLLATLTLMEQAPGLVLKGTFYTRSLDLRIKDQNLFKGTIELKKERSGTQTTLLAKLTELDLLTTLSFVEPSVTAGSDMMIAEKKTSTAIAIASTPAKPITLNSISNSFLAARKIEIIKTISFQSDSLLLSVYDNGEVDGDTVSIYLNGKIVIAQQALKSNPINTTIHLTPDLGDSVQLTMYAENLGSIAPNTGVLIIQDGLNRNEVRFSGDLQKNAAIILKRKQ